jgi:hypothetical protein
MLAAPLAQNGPMIANSAPMLAASGFDRWRPDSPAQISERVALCPAGAAKSLIKIGIIE